MSHLLKALAAVLATALSIPVTAVPARAEEMRAHSVRYDIRSGLSSNIVNGIAQDRDGFLWFATNSGISRFDGYDFKSIPFSTREDSSVEISHVALSEGRMAAVSAAGAMLLDIRTGCTTAVPDSIANCSSLKSCIATGDGRFIFGGKEGVLIFDPENGTMRPVSFTDTEGNNILWGVRTMFQDLSGAIWIGTWKNGVFVLDPESDSPAHISDILPGDLFVTCFEEHGGRMYIGSWSSGIYVLNGTNSGISVQNIDTGALGWNITYDITFDKSGNLWAGTPAGVRALSLKAGKPSPIFLDEGDGPFTVREIRETKTIFCDSDGCIWASDQGKGLVKIFRPQSTIREVDLTGLGLEFGEVSAISKGPDGALWMGVNGVGLVRYDMGSGTILPQDRILSGIRGEANSITAFVGMPEHRQMILATRYDGAYLIGMDGGVPVSLKHLDTSREGLRNGFTNDAAPAAGGGVWIATDNGAVLLRRNGQEFSVNEPDDLNAIIGFDRVECVLHDRRGYLWLSTRSHGLYRMQYNMLTSSVSDSKEYDILPGKAAAGLVQAMFEDSRGTIWAADDTYGLFRYDPDEDSFVPAADTFPLYGNGIHAVTEDARGCLWLSTDSGFLCHDPYGDGKVIPSSSISNRLSNVTFMPRSAWSDGNTICFGGYKGLSICDPALFVKNITPRPPAITDIRVHGGGEVALTVYSPYVEDVTLSHRQRNISITFASPGTGNEGKISYAYRLDNADREWVPVPDDSRTVSFSNLRAGHYTFRVRAMSFPDDWTEATELKITVKPHLMLSWWFLAVLVLISAAAVARFLKSPRKKDGSGTAEMPLNGTDLDNQFIEKAVHIIESHLSDPEFDVEAFNAAMHMSNSTLYRKIKALTGTSPKDFIRKIRFRYAARYLMEKSANVSSVAYLVGFSNAKYFSQSFKKEFGITPSQYISEHKNKTK